MSTAPHSILLLSADAERLAGLRALVRAIAPGWVLLEAVNVADAALAATSSPLTLAVLDHAAASPLSPLVRVLRRQAPDVRVLVFADDPSGVAPPVYPWAQLPERLGAAVRRAGPVTV